ncbi:hypothetical protein G4B88_020450, partial [Cannabis sativa]
MSRSLIYLVVMSNGRVTPHNHHTTRLVVQGHIKIVEGNGRLRQTPIGSIRLKYSQHRQFLLSSDLHLLVSVHVSIGPLQEKTVGERVQQKKNRREDSCLQILIKPCVPKTHISARRSDEFFARKYSKRPGRGRPLGHDSIGDKIQRYRGILLLEFVPLLLVGLFTYFILMETLIWSPLVAILSYFYTSFFVIQEAVPIKLCSSTPATTGLRSLPKDTSERVLQEVIKLHRLGTLPRPLIPQLAEMTLKQLENLSPHSIALIVVGNE